MVMVKPGAYLDSIVREVKNAWMFQ
jgi:hypothetical protein